MMLFQDLLCMVRALLIPSQCTKLSYNSTAEAGLTQFRMHGGVLLVLQQYMQIMHFDCTCYHICILSAELEQGLLFCISSLPAG